VPYDPRIHHRRSIRLQGYNYSQEGAYFVTVCVQDRVFRLGAIENDEMRPSEAGRMVLDVWHGLPSHYPGVDIDTFQLMPNHLHGIIVLYAQDDDPPREPYAPPTDRLGRAEGATCAMSLFDIVQRFKSLTTTRYRQAVYQRGWPPFRHRLWQRNYHEHVIRDEADLDRVRRYIVDNPLNWETDPENPTRKSQPKGEPWQV
jgi:putative transposase